MKDATLAALFGRYRAHGDGRALAAVFDRTAKELLELACHLVRDPLEAEDLVQATFVAAIQKRASYDARAPLQAWLYGILWREAAKARRRAARALDPRRLSERSAPDPHALAVEGELPEAVGAALKRLPAHYREVLEPMLFHEQRPEHIARELARSPGTVRSQIHRGLEELRRALTPRFAAYGALALPTRGLASVRAEVLRAAGFSPATAALPPATALTLTVGGLLASKSVLVAASAAAVVLSGAWVALEQRSGESGVPSVAASEGALASRVSTGAAERSAPESERGIERAPERELAPPTEPSALSWEEQSAYWLARFGEHPDDWRHGWSVAKEIALLAPDDALAVMTAVWPHLSVPVKEQVLKPFVFNGGHVHALKVLHLAATDATLSVQGRAFEYLKDYAFQDFTLDYEAYLAWAAVHKDRSVGEVLADNARRFVADMLAATPTLRAERMLGLRALDLRAGGPAGVDLVAVLRAAGGWELLEVCLADPDAELQELALSWSRTLQVDELWLRTWALPALQRPESVPPGVLVRSILALGRSDCTWAVEPLLGYLEQATRAEAHGASCASQALAEIGDPAVIPRLIGLLLRDQTGKLVKDVGYDGLARLTGVSWQESYDGEWWAEWWAKNRRRFSPEIAALDVPR